MEKFNFDEIDRVILAVKERRDLYEGMLPQTRKPSDRYEISQLNLILNKLYKYRDAL